MIDAEDVSRHRILQLATHLLDRPIAEITPAMFSEGSFTKSDIADVIEGHHFGVEKNNRTGPDFTETGIELKVTPLGTNASGRIIRPKERLVISAIDYEDIAANEDWDAVAGISGKLDPVLIIWYDASADDRSRHRVVWVALWRPTRAQSEQMQADYEQMRSRVLAGKRLSGSDGEFLSSCPRHAGGWDEDPAIADQGSIVGSHPTLDHAQRRAWQIKPRGMTDVLAEATDLPIVDRPARGVETDALYDALDERAGSIDGERT
jgi:DNA mismatch repair protein MutH